MNAEGTVAEVLTGVAKWSTLVGDVRETLRTVPDGCAQTCVTSPPYYGLRDYGAAGQIGQEQSPAEYVAAMVAVMRDVRRVLADDGTLWLNLGDSYVAAASGKTSGDPHAKSTVSVNANVRAARSQSADKTKFGLPEKNLIGIPWRTALALQNDGWILRAEIIWAKGSPMPEAATDRPTREHEHVFLFSKRPRYFYDARAIEERSADGSRNARSVWEINASGCAEAHFATMPPELARRCILAGSRSGDVVLDPFGGAATTALVALQHGRRAVLCELNPEYVEIQRRRLAVFDADAVSPVRVAAPEWGALFDARRPEAT
jgi:DNA modification methylase